jgi:hypothetical protein
MGKKLNFITVGNTIFEKILRNSEWISKILINLRKTGDCIKKVIHRI